MVADNAKRLSITGPCKVSWKDGFRRTVAHRFPDASANPESAVDEER
jgi:hypothetical protein